MPVVAKTSVLPGFVGASLGHFWTIVHHLGRSQPVSSVSTTRPFFVTLPDPLTSSVTLSGTLHAASSNATSHRDLVLLIHGLGGSAQSGYMLEATRTALTLGLDVLRVNLRGADQQGTDFYHAGLYTDILAILQQDAVRAYRNVYGLGISLGGHALLRTAQCPDLPKNVRSMATWCPPLDLAACSTAFDKKRLWVYRRHVLDGLKEMYVRFALTHAHARHKLGLPSPDVANAIATIGEWDRTIVAPRHGFASANDYYASQSAGPRLAQVHLPTLILTTRWDPMVPHHTTAHHLVPNTSPQLSSTYPSDESAVAPWAARQVTRHVQHVELSVGGHIAFPQRGDASVFERTLRWLQHHGT